MREILSMFHHTHHKDGKHRVHHCGGKHVHIDPKVSYTIDHCSCGKHSIDKRTAIGHATNEHLDSVECSIVFTESCPDGGWHVESGVLK